MNTKQKLNYILSVVQSCKNNIQLRTARQWAFGLIDSWNVSDFDKQEFKHKIRITKHYVYENN